MYEILSDIILQEKARDDKFGPADSVATSSAATLLIPEDVEEDDEEVLITCVGAVSILLSLKALRRLFFSGDRSAVDYMALNYLYIVI